MRHANSPKTDAPSAQAGPYGPYRLPLEPEVINRYVALAHQERARVMRELFRNLFTYLGRIIGVSRAQVRQAPMAGTQLRYDAN